MIELAVTSYFVPSGSTEACTEAVATQQRARQEGGGGEESSPYPIPLPGKRKKCEAMGSQLSVK